MPSHGGTHVIPQQVEAHLHPGGHSALVFAHDGTGIRTGEVAPADVTALDVDLAHADAAQPLVATEHDSLPQTQSPLPMHTSGTVGSVDDVGGGLPGSPADALDDSTTGAVHATAPPTATFFRKSRRWSPVCSSSIAGPLCQLDADLSHRTELPNGPSQVLVAT